MRTDDEMPVPDPGGGWSSVTYACRLSSCVQHCRAFWIEIVETSKCNKGIYAYASCMCVAEHVSPMKLVRERSDADNDDGASNDDVPKFKLPRITKS